MLINRDADFFMGEREQRSQAVGRGFVVKTDGKGGFFCFKTGV
jgi:hypothetical protein